MILSIELAVNKNKMGTNTFLIFAGKTYGKYKIIHYNTTKT